MNNPVNAFGRNSGGVDQFTTAIPDTDGKGSFVKVNTNKGFCSHLSSPYRLVVRENDARRLFLHIITSLKERLRAIVPERRLTMQTLKRFKAITRSIARRPASLHSFIYVGDVIATPYMTGE